MLCFRSFTDKTFVESGHGLLLQHLFVSEFLMGLYLLIVAVADQVYRQRYLWNYLAWQSSGFCKVIVWYTNDDNIHIHHIQLSIVMYILIIMYILAYRPAMRTFQLALRGYSAASLPRASRLII